jgi:tetratricopeptide (TPR) repeat protein
MLHTLFQMVGVNYSSGNLNAVESAVRSILATVPNDLTSLQFLGLVYYRTGRKAEAMRILESEPPQPDPPSRFDAAPGVDILSRNAYSAVAACHVEATHRSSDLAMVWFDLGVVLSELGKPERALGAFRSALAACPAKPKANWVLGPIAMDLAPTVRATDLGPLPLEDDE